VGNAWRLAVGTLTAVPVPAPRSLTPPVPGRAMALAPVAGLAPGLTAAGVAWAGLHADLRPAVLAALALAAFALATRGLHLDGLADTADGFAASYDRERALTVMRRGDTGPAGLATVVLVLLVQYSALQQVLSLAVNRVGYERTGVLRAALVLVVIAVAARVAVPLLCLRGVPAARPEGLGATVAGTVPPVLLTAVVGASAVGCALLTWSAGLRWWTGLLAVAAVVVVAALTVLRARSRLGGVTGDVIGFAVEVGAAAALVVVAATA
jgi:adenosylcobinamide-GDP ribazoletransferase